MITNDVSTMHWKSSSTSVSPLYTNIFRRHKQKQWSPTRNHAEKSTDSWWFPPHCCGFRALPPHFPQPRTLWITNPLLESPFCFKLMGKTSRESFTLLTIQAFFRQVFCPFPIFLLLPFLLLSSFASERSRSVDAFFVIHGIPDGRLESWTIVAIFHGWTWLTFLVNLNLYRN